MVITEKIEVKWNPTTRAYYENKGYEYTNHSDSFLVNIEDLHLGSNYYVEVQCDYCGTIVKSQYKQYIESMDKSEVNKYSCDKCKGKKQKDIADLLQSRGLLNKSSEYYYSYKENVNKEILKYLDRYKTIDNISYLDKKLYQKVYKHDSRNMYEIINDLGLNWDDISSKKPDNYYRNFDNLKNEIEGFISEYGRFPNTSELKKDLGIYSVALNHHGGINGVKVKMGYVDDNDYIDDDGFNNRSLAEYITAQYLIANGISYLREQYPFPNNENKYRSDFLLRTVDGKDIHIEVWGFSHNANDKITKLYNDTRKIKEELYDKYNIELVSIEGINLTNVNYKDKQVYLKNKLSHIVNKELTIFEDIVFLHPTKLTDTQLLEIIMRYADNKHTIPCQDKIIQAGMNRYLVEIRKRFNSYYDFARKFDMNLDVKYTIWDDYEIYNAFKDIVENESPINKNSLVEYNYNGMLSKLRVKYKNSGITTAKLEFYNEYLSKSIKIHEDDIRSIYNISKNRAFSSEKITTEDIELACSIIKLISNSELNIILKSIIKEEERRYTPEIELQKEEYTLYFNSLNLKGKDLYPKQFNKISKYSTKSYLRTFKMSWIDFLDSINRKEELISNTKEDIINLNKASKVSVSKFMLSIGLPYDDTVNEIKDILYECTNTRNNKEVNIELLHENFHSIINDLNSIPFYTQFNELTNHTIKTYSVHLGLPNSYDQIVKYYVTEDEFNDYLVRKKKHKSDIAKKTAKTPNKISEEKLKDEFKKVYDSYFMEYGKYPTMRKFNEVSAIDESVYRKRFKMKFSEIAKMYGY